MRKKSSAESTEGKETSRDNFSESGKDRRAEPRKENALAKNLGTQAAVRHADPDACVSAGFLLLSHVWGDSCV